MNEILSTLITPEVKAVFIIMLIVLVILYLMSIVWVVRDSYLRGASPVVWGIVAVIPFLGAMIYSMMRPPLYASDQEEQNIGLLLQQRELMAYGECPQCGYPTERDYIICPNCHAHLKNTCARCGHTLEPEWSICPYCATEVVGGANRAPARRRVVQQQPPRSLKQADPKQPVQKQPVQQTSQQPAQKQPAQRQVAARQPAAAPSVTRAGAAPASISASHRRVAASSGAAQQRVSGTVQRSSARAAASRQSRASQSASGSPRSSSTPQSRPSAGRTNTTTTE